MAVTTWNTVPNYDEWGSDTYWSCEDWIQYHKLLKQLQTHDSYNSRNLIYTQEY